MISDTGNPGFVSNNIQYSTNSNWHYLILEILLERETESSVQSLQQTNNLKMYFYFQYTSSTGNYFIIAIWKIVCRFRLWLHWTWLIALSLPTITIKRPLQLETEYVNNLFKLVSSNKRQSHIDYIFPYYFGITDTALT